MRVLLDGCVPKHLARELSVHEVQTAPEMGWGNLDDGPLLDVIAGRFDVLVTVDKSLPKQQRLNNRPFAVIVLRAKTNRLADLLPLSRHFALQSKNSVQARFANWLANVVQVEVGRHIAALLGNAERIATAPRMAVPVVRLEYAPRTIIPA